MKTILVTCLLTAVAVISWAQGNEPVQRSSSPSGLRINDSGQIAGSAVLNNRTALTPVELNNAATAPAKQAAGKSTVQIQGNTAIKANAKNLHSVATGGYSAAGNEVGAIGK